MAGMPYKTALLGALGTDDETPEDVAGPPLENTGIAGGKFQAPRDWNYNLPNEPGGATGPLLVDSPAAPKSTAPSADYGRLMGYDLNKLNDPNKRDFKYDTARVMSKYDPRGGFTPELLNELTGLGYGTFSSKGGDKLSLTGAKNAKDAADFADQDWIYASKANNDATKWMFGGGGAGGGSSGGVGGAIPAGPVGAHSSGIPVDPRLTGDPLAAIQAALAQYSTSPNIQALLKQLGGA